MWCDWQEGEDARIFWKKIVLTSSLHFFSFLHKQRGSKCYPNIVFFHQRLPTPYGHSEKYIKHCKSNAIANEQSHTHKNDNT